MNSIYQKELETPIEYDIFYHVDLMIFSILNKCNITLIINDIIKTNNHD